MSDDKRRPVHRLADHMGETLCGHRVSHIRDDAGMLLRVVFSKSQKPVRIARTAHSFADDCNTCYHIWKCANLGDTTK